jgi:hypothetical protein
LESWTRQTVNLVKKPILAPFRLARTILAIVCAWTDLGQDKDKDEDMIGHFREKVYGNVGGSDSPGTRLHSL